MQPITFLDSVSGKYKRVNIDKTNFIVRKNFIFEIKPSFLLNCKSFSGIMSCGHNGLFHSWTPCLEALYFSNNNDSKPCLVCKTLTDPRKKTIIERLNTEEIHFALKFLLAVSIECTDGKYYTADTKMSSCPEKASAYSSQIACNDVHIFMKIVSVILMYMKFY